MSVKVKNYGRCTTEDPLYSGKPQTSTFANSEDPDEMHDAPFHQGLHCL